MATRVGSFVLVPLHPEDNLAHPHSHAPPKSAAADRPSAVKTPTPITKGAVRQRAVNVSFFTAETCQACPRRGALQASELPQNAPECIIWWHEPSVPGPRELVPSALVVPLSIPDKRVAAVMLAT